MLRPAHLAGGGRDDRDRGDHRARRQLAARLLDPGGAAAGLDPGRHRRRRDLRAACAARPCGAGSRARSRPSPGSTTRSPSCSSSGSSTGSRSPATGSPTWPGCSRASSGIGRGRGRGGGGWPPCGPSSGSTSRRPASIPVASIATAGARLRGAAAIIDGSGFLAVYLTGLALGGAHIPAKRTITAFHEGLAWVAQIALFLTLGLLVFPSQLGDVLFEGTLVALVVVLVARPAGHLRRNRFRSLHAARAVRPRAGRGFAARCPWCWRPSR